MRFALVLALAATPAFANPKIAADDHVTEALVGARMGDVIRNTCPSISARYFAVLGAMSDLKAYARSQGYTEEEVKLFLKDPEQKARISALADKRLAKAGVKAGDVESYCVAGRAEIAAGSATGKLLRSWK